MTHPTDKEIREAAEKHAGNVMISSRNCDWRSAQEDGFKAGAQFILSSLPKPAEGDVDAAYKYLKENQHPNTDYDSFLAGIQHARAQSQAEIASLKAEVGEYRALIKSISCTCPVISKYDTSICKRCDTLAKYPEREE